MERGQRGRGVGGAALEAEPLQRCSHLGRRRERVGLQQRLRPLHEELVGEPRVAAVAALVERARDGQRVERLGVGRERRDAERDLGRVAAPNEQLRVAVDHAVAVEAAVGADADAERRVGRVVALGGAAGRRTVAERQQRRGRHDGARRPVGLAAHVGGVRRDAGDGHLDRRERPRVDAVAAGRLLGRAGPRVGRERVALAGDDVDAKVARRRAGGGAGDEVLVEDAKGAVDVEQVVGDVLVGRVHAVEVVEVALLVLVLVLLFCCFEVSLCL